MSIFLLFKVSIRRQWPPLANTDIASNTVVYAPHSQSSRILLLFIVLTVGYGMCGVGGSPTGYLFQTKVIILFYVALTPGAVSP